MTSSEEKILMAIGELKGSIDGLSTVVKNNDSAMNRRIDDLGSSMNKRLDSQDAHIIELRRIQTKLMLRSSLAGGVSGGFIVALSELVKVLG